MSGEHKNYHDEDTDDRECDDGDKTRLDGIVQGSGGDDSIDLAYTGDPEGDRIDNGDAILAGEAPDDDIVVAGSGDDWVRGGVGDDDIFGGTDDDFLKGQEGDDTIRGDSNGPLSGDDVPGGDAGDPAGSDSILGWDGNDTLYGEGGRDYIYGGADDDAIHGGDGDDGIHGDTGDDVIHGGAVGLPDRGYPGVFPADADPFNDRDEIEGGHGDDTIFGHDDNDLIAGDAGNDTLDGGFDDDTITGGEGHDTIIGGEGSDAIDGGAGGDTIYGGLSPAFPDSLNIPDDTDLVQDNGMDVIHGGTGDDTIFGQDDDDSIHGDDGDDTLDGGIDEDALFGDAGSDTLTGGQGNDTLDGGQDDAMADMLAGNDDRDSFTGVGAGDSADGGTGGDDVDTLDLTGAGGFRIVDQTVDADGDSTSGKVNFVDDHGATTGTMSFREIENIIPCFTPGTTIATPRGQKLVEDLREGDKVITRDNGIQEIRWLGMRTLRGRELITADHMKPILIRAGALGNGLPERDMLVSPNHRVLVANDRTALYFEEHEVLVAAKHLVNNRGIETVDCFSATYIHFMFEAHEVVLSNGAWSESFQPGDYTLGGMGNAQRNEIFQLFPELETAEGLSDYQAARKTLKKHEASLLNL